MDIGLFVNITSRAWALSVLSSLHTGVAARQAPLLAVTGASRTAFAQSMEHLISLDLLERNPGYGHPLRPEFRLTEQGVIAASIANKIYCATEERDQDLLRRSWTLPVLTAIHAPNSFNQIKRSLVSVSDRALSQSLQAMESRSWVSRRISDTVRPPRPVYQAINAGGLISGITAAEITFGQTVAR